VALSLAFGLVVVTTKLLPQLWRPPPRPWLGRDIRRRPGAPGSLGFPSPQHPLKPGRPTLQQSASAVPGNSAYHIFGRQDKPYAETKSPRRIRNATRREAHSPACAGRNRWTQLALGHEPDHQDRIRPPTSTRTTTASTRSDQIRGGRLPRIHSGRPSPSPRVSPLRLRDTVRDPNSRRSVGIQAVR
jgi:hypothetical protein